MTSHANPLDSGPFYHGTAAELKVGEMLQAGFRSNYQPELVMTHIYFTSDVAGAGLAAAVAAGDEKQVHVYEIEPVGPWEDDPNVTDKKFPGNPTHSYRSELPLRIIREILDFPEPDRAVVARIRAAFVKSNRGKIIN